MTHRLNSETKWQHQRGAIINLAKYFLLSLAIYHMG